MNELASLEKCEFNLSCPGGEASAVKRPFLFLDQGDVIASKKYRSRCYILIKIMIICDNFPFSELYYLIIKLCRSVVHSHT